MSSSRPRRITVHEAKTNLSRLIERAERGEEVLIHRGTVPVARLVAFRREKPQRKFGAMKGQFKVGDAFFGPLSDDELAAWEG